MAKHLLDAAIAYARRGWAVHPVNLQKKPTTEHGFYDATTDESTVRQYFSNGAQVSIRTGAASGVFVLDLDEDSEKGYSVARTLTMIAERYGPLPHTPHQRTGRGGLQYFFKHQEGLRNKAGSLLGPGIDTRGEGGYAVVAPSRNTNGAYEWIVSPDEAPLADAPAWLVELMTKRTEQPARPTNGHAPEAYAQAALANEVSAVLRAQNGTRNDTLNRAAFSLGQLVGAGLLGRDQVEQALRGAAGAAGLAARETDATIKSGLDAGEQDPRKVPDRKPRAAQRNAAPEPEPPHSGDVAEDDDLVALGPKFDAKGYAYCPNCDRRLKKAKNGNGWRCPRKGEQLCFWWDGEGYTPPEKPEPAAGGALQSEQIIARLAELGYSFRRNLCDDTIEVNGRPIDDITRAKLRMAARDHHIEPLAALEDAWTAEAANHDYHPVRDYLASLQWDGADHIGQLAARLQSSDTSVAYPDGSITPLHAVYLRRWLIGAVAKALGSQQNMLLVLAGPQGIGKSALVRWLCGGLPDLFLEAPINPNDKDNDVRLISRFIWEVSELDATTRKADVSAVKAFVTKGQVVVRKAYGHHDMTKPALASFIGTVNESTGFLSDETGSRRFLVTTITAIDWGYTAIDVDQLWAQAVALYHAGEPWRLLPCEVAHQQEANRRHEVESVLEGWIQKHFFVGSDLASRMTAADIVDHLRHYDIHLAGNERAQAMELSRILVRLGAEKVRTASWRGYRGIAPRPTPVTTSSDNLEEEVVTENTAPGSPNDNLTTCDNLFPYEDEGFVPVGSYSSPSIKNRLSQVVTTLEEGQQDATNDSDNLTNGGCHEVVTGAEVVTPDGSLARVDWHQVERFARSGEWEKLRSWCKVYWKPAEPDDVLAEARRRWPELAAREAALVDGDESLE